MNQTGRKIGWLAWWGLTLIVLTLLLALIMAGAKMSGALGKPLPVLGTVASFTLTNQFGQPVSLDSLTGRVWLADIIFTRCAGPCPKMSREMKLIQDALPPSSDARLVSLTTDPAFDTPAVLHAYAQRFGADTNRWIFLTGTPTDIAKTATESLKLSALPKPAEARQSPSDLFIHSTLFVLVDKQSRLRGIYETAGDDVDPQRVRAGILAAIRRLERER